jgi:hypothetical protein
MKLLYRLGLTGAEFILVGGLAMCVHGPVETVIVLDVCYRPTPENVRRISAALELLEPRLRGDFVGALHRFEHGVNLALATAVGPINLLPGLNGVGTFEQVQAQSAIRHVNGLPIWVLSLDGMIAAQQASGKLKEN